MGVPICPQRCVHTSLPYYNSWDCDTIFFFQSSSWNYSLSLIYEFYLISSRIWKLFSVYIINSYKAAFLAPSFSVLWVCLLIAVHTVSCLPWLYTHWYLVQKSATHSSSICHLFPLLFVLWNFLDINANIFIDFFTTF